VQIQYWRVDSKKDGIWTKGDLWQFGSSQGKATLVYPANNATISDADLTLRWNPSPWPTYLVNQNVYYGTSAAAVTDANTSTVGVFQGEKTPATDSLYVGALDLGAQRWWRIDSNLTTTPPVMVKGDIWHLTMAQFYTIEDFDWYGGSDNLRDVWLDYYTDGTGDNGAIVTEQREPNRYATHSYLMDFDWFTAGSTHFDTERTFASPIDMTVFDLAALTLYSYGDPCNTSDTGGGYSLSGPQKIYVTLSDDPNSVPLPYDGDANDIFVNQWAEWNIALADFAPVALNAVTSIKLSVTNEYTGNGHVKFDDIRLYKQRCVPHLSGIQEVDVNADCIINGPDLWSLKGQWLKSGSAYNFHTTDPIVNCLDYAILAAKWQQGDLFPK
jgi:hypothetical protein